MSFEKIPDYEFVVLESHLDTFGHVNNATYLTLFEQARWQIITDRSYGLAEVQKERKGPIILEVNLKFLKELKLRETITIRSEIFENSSKFSKMKQQMLKSDGKVAAEAIFTFGFFDLQTRRLIEPSQEWLHAIGVHTG